MSAESERINSPNFSNCSVILLDVAGTTTSIDFVKKTLFPYFVSNIESFLKSNWDTEAVKEGIKLLAIKDEISVDKVVDVVKKLTENDSDNEGLKNLQGLVYKKGYKDGSLKSHVFPDVPKAFETWSKSHRTGIYSTGSVTSQELLFKHTKEGDLTPHITKYFDLKIGIKTEASSYVKIVEEFNVKPQEIIFASDNIDEVKAAKEAGLNVVLVEREGNADLSEEAKKEFLCVTKLTDIPTEVSKRKMEETPDNAEPPTKIAKTEETTKISDVKTDNASAEVEIVVEKAVEAMEVESSTVTKEDVEKTTVTSEKNADVEKETVVTEKSDEKKTEEQKVETDTPMEEAKTEEIVKDAPNSPKIADKEEKKVGESIEHGENKLKDTEIINKKCETQNSDKEEVKVTEPENTEVGDKTSDVPKTTEMITVSITEEKLEVTEVTNEQGETVCVTEKKSETILITNEKEDADPPKTEDVVTEKTEKEAEKPIVDKKSEEKITVEDSKTDVDKDEVKNKEVEGKNNEVEVKNNEVEVKNNEVEVKNNEVEMKETNGDLSNGKTNGIEDKTTNGEKTEEAEIKVKKLEDTAESTTVSIEA